MPPRRFSLLLAQELGDWRVDVARGSVVKFQVGAQPEHLVAFVFCAVGRVVLCRGNYQHGVHF